MLHHDSELLSRNEGPYCVAPRQRIRKFVFCTQDEGVGFVADSCADVLRVANRLLRKDRFSWAQTMGLSGLNEFLKIRPAGLAVILVGGADNPWRVAEKDLTSLRPNCNRRPTWGLSAPVFSHFENQVATTTRRLRCIPTSALPSLKLPRMQNYRPAKSPTHQASVRLREQLLPSG